MGAATNPRQLRVACAEKTVTEQLLAVAGAVEAAPMRAKEAAKAWALLRRIKISMDENHLEQSWTLFNVRREPPPPQNSQTTAQGS